MNSTLGSVVPLAMFTLALIKKEHIAPIRAGVGMGKPHLRATCLAK